MVGVGVGLWQLSNKATDVQMIAFSQATQVRFVIGFIFYQKKLCDHIKN